MKNFWKNLFVIWVGGSIYLEIELLKCGQNLWMAFFMGCLVFGLCALFNEIWAWGFSIIGQVFVGTIIVTTFQFIVGGIGNLMLGLNMWDYSDMPLNLLGQVCAPVMLSWTPLVLVGIVLDDVIRWKMLGEEAPVYWIGNKCLDLGYSCVWYGGKK